MIEQKKSWLNLYKLASEGDQKKISEAAESHAENFTDSVQEKDEALRRVKKRLKHADIINPISRKKIMRELAKQIAA